ncbi:MAG: hypothetical protein SGPRY_006220 [Prymnesium sp.]
MSTTLQAMGSPHTVQRSWDMSRAAPVAASPHRVAVRSLASKDPVELELTEGATVADLKGQICQKLSISPRKKLTLRWYGTALEDARTLHQLNVPDGATLEMSSSVRSATEIEELKAQLKQVRIKSTDGRTVLIEALKPTTKVLEIKKTIAERKFFKAEEGFLSVDAKNPLIYSSVFNASFGVPLDDEKTLGSYGMINDDIILFKPPVDPEYSKQGNDKGSSKGAKDKGKSKK